MERFKKFNEMFANFPTLQKDLSLLDKPATNGKLFYAHSIIQAIPTDTTQALHHPIVAFHRNPAVCNHRVQWALAIAADHHLQEERSEDQAAPRNAHQNIVDAHLRRL